MSWIKIINYENAKPRLKRIYDRIKSPNNTIDNVLLVHSLRPHTLEGHLSLYKNVLHNANNTLPKWYLEALGVYVSFLNKCDYCFEHHYTGFKKLYANDLESDKFRAAVIDDNLEVFLEDNYLAGCKYAKELTLNHSNLKKENIELLRTEGFSDGEILEMNQVISYFNYANRTVVGLGVEIEKSAH